MSSGGDNDLQKKSINYTKDLRRILLQMYTIKVTHYWLKSKDLMKT